MADVKFATDYIEKKQEDVASRLLTCDSKERQFYEGQLAMCRHLLWWWNVKIEGDPEPGQAGYTECMMARAEEASLEYRAHLRRLERETRNG